MKKVLLIILSILMVNIFYAQEDTIAVTEEEVTVLGTRNKNRSVIESTVPIDVIDVNVVSDATGQVEINQLLQFAAPSFNSNKQSGSDGADHIDPATLRGLGPDQTLVLINGKRRHQTSLVNLFGTRGRGNSGTDLNAIPLGAIDKLEILRDGAAAQYGSDAIAGVINIGLKKSVGVFTGDLYYGANLFHSGEGYHLINDDKTLDGNTFAFSGNYGAKLGEKGGFINVTLEFVDKQGAIRTGDPAFWTEIYRDKYGDAASRSFQAFYNAEVPISKIN